MEEPGAYLRRGPSANLRALYRGALSRIIGLAQEYEGEDHHLIEEILQTARWGMAQDHEEAPSADDVIDRMEREGYR